MTYTMACGCQVRWQPWCPEHSEWDVVDVPELVKEVKKLREVVRQHDLCHDLHGKVDAEAFAEGCAAEQRRIYGCAPHADRLELAELDVKEFGRLASEWAAKAGRAEGAMKALKWPGVIEEWKREIASQRNELERHRDLEPLMAELFKAASKVLAAPYMESRAKGKATRVSVIQEEVMSRLTEAILNLRAEGYKGRGKAIHYGNSGRDDEIPEEPEDDVRS
jgi:hypothetical protein